MATLTNKEVTHLHNACASLDVDLPFKVWYAIDKSRKSLEKPAKDYEEARVELAKRHAKKHKKDIKATDDTKEVKKGDPIIEDNVYVFEDKKTFTKELEALLEEKSEISIHTIKDIKLLDSVKVPQGYSGHFAVIMDHLLDEEAALAAV